MSNADFHADKELIDAILFFHIENDKSKAKDISWLTQQNVYHSLDPKKKQESNMYFGILRTNQHKIDYIYGKLQSSAMSRTNYENEMAASKEAPKSYEEPKRNEQPRQSQETQAQWYEKSPQASRPAQNQPQQQYSSRNNDEMENFKNAVRKSFERVQIEGDNVATRTGKEKGGHTPQQSQPYNNYHSHNSYGNNYGNSYGQNNYNNYNRPSSMKMRPDGLAKAGCIISIISASINILTTLGLMYWMGGVATFIIIIFSIWTIVANGQVLSGSARSKTGAGVLGLLFGFLLGGIFTLAGRYERD